MTRVLPPEDMPRVQDFLAFWSKVSMPPAWFAHTLFRLGEVTAPPPVASSTREAAHKTSHALGAGGIGGKGSGKGNGSAGDSAAATVPSTDADTRGTGADEPSRKRNRAQQASRHARRKLARSRNVESAPRS